MLDIDPTGKRPAQVAHQLFVRGRILKWIVGQNLQKPLRLRFQMRCDYFPRILLRLLGKNDRPTHQPGFVEVLSSDSFIPLRMESRMPGMETR